MGRPISPETLVYGLTNAEDPQVSPDGRRVVYTSSTTDAESKKGQSEVWICDIDGGNARQLTHGGTRNGGARWSPNGSQIAFVSDRVGEKKAGIFVLPAGSGGLCILVRAKP